MKIGMDYKWSLIVNGVNITSNCAAVQHLPQPFRPDEDINSVLVFLDKLSICPGHPEDRFVRMMKEKKVVSGSAHLDASSNVTLSGQTYNVTVRTSSCHLLIATGSRCPSCSAYRPTLRKMSSRWKVKSSPSKHVSTRSKTNLRSGVYSLMCLLYPPPSIIIIYTPLYIIGIWEHHSGKRG